MRIRKESNPCSNLTLLLSRSWCVGLALAASGCQSVDGKVATLESQNRMLTEQSRATGRDRESQDPRPPRRGPADPAPSRTLAAGPQVAGNTSPAAMPAGMSGRLAALAETLSDPALRSARPASASSTPTCCSTRATPSSSRAPISVPNEFAEIFNSPEGRELKLMVVGHADSQAIKGHELRIALSDQLALECRPRADGGRLAPRARACRKSRMGVAGFGEFQPHRQQRLAPTRAAATAAWRSTCWAPRRRW